MSQPPASRPSLAKRLAPIALVVACGGVGCGVSFGVRALLPAPPAEVAEREPEDDHPATESPLRQRLDVAVRSGNYSAGLKLARELLADADADPPTRYALALCLEGLERWDEALDEYRRLGSDGQPAGVRAVAACGEVRCRLAEGHTGEAADALARAEGFAAGPGLSPELAYLRGRVAYRGLSACEPGPFAPDRPMGAEPRLAPAGYPDWLPLPTSAGGDGGPTAHATPPTDPAATAAEAFAAVLAADPPHPDEPAVRLAFADLLLRAGNADAAAREYKAVRESHPPQAVLVAATYNLGLIHHRRGEWAVARQLFTDAADLAPGTPASALGWWWVGRTLLDTGDPDGCGEAWERADATTDNRLRTAVVAGKVFLHLLAGESERAAKLFHGKKLANSDTVSAVAEAFACYFTLGRREHRFPRRRASGRDPPGGRRRAVRPGRAVGVRPVAGRSGAGRTRWPRCTTRRRRPPEGRGRCGSHWPPPNTCWPAGRRTRRPGGSRRSPRPTPASGATGRGCGWPRSPCGRAARPSA